MCHSSRHPHQAPGQSPMKLQPTGYASRGRRVAANDRAATSTNVWIHATLERSDSALKLQADQRYRVPSKRPATRRADTPDFCAISHLEREAAGANVSAVGHYSAVLKVMYGAVLGFWSADRKVFEQSQRVVCTSITFQKLQKTKNSAASCIKSTNRTHRR